MRFPRDYLIANYAMFVGDFDTAIRLYNKCLRDKKIKYPLLLYKIYFCLAIASSYKGNREVLDANLKRLERIYQTIEESRKDMQEKIRKIESLIEERFNVEHFVHLLEEYFPRDEKILSLIISPNYSRRYLRSALRRGEEGKTPEVMVEGIFKYTLHPEADRLVVKAYTTEECKLERLLDSEHIKVLLKKENVFYVADETSNIIGAVYREGLVLSQYFFQSPQDTKGAKRIRKFMKTLTEILR